LLALTKKLSDVRVLVVGDIILDHYIQGSADRLSPEAPVPVVWAKKEKYVLGGASNVSHNIAAMSATAYMCGVVGKDHNGYKVIDLLHDKKIKTDYVFESTTRPTTLKTRVVANHQQIVRIDWEETGHLPADLNERIVKAVKERINDIDVVIIEDYGKGVINPHLLTDLVALCREHKKIITVDPKDEHFDYYQGVTSLTPNLKEAAYFVDFKVKTDEDIDRCGKAIMDRLQSESLLITLGDKGMKLFRKDGSTFHLPTFAQEVFDVSGAGDTVIAIFSLALGTGATFEEAAALSNLAAGIVVGKLGTAVTDPEELAQKVEDTYDRVKKGHRA
jgi:D-beta-D-heptose 7-phosphate kinase/D-beta-D-heptose 1-phosphate adenosyltransferase